MTNERKSVLTFSAIPMKEMTTQMYKLLISYSISWLDWGDCNCTASGQGVSHLPTYILAVQRQPNTVVDL